MHALRILQHLVIPEPKHPISFALQKLRAHNFIGRVQVMLPTVCLDDQIRRMANEVYDVWPDRHLPPELEAFDLT